MGAAALEMDAASDGSRQTQWRSTVAARLPSQHWLQRTMLITAVDAHTSDRVRNGQEKRARLPRPAQA
jgi:NTE family protein